MDEPSPQFTPPPSHPPSAPPPMGSQHPPAAVAPAARKKQGSLGLVFITICFALSAFCGIGMAGYVLVLMPEETEAEPVATDAGAPDAGFDGGFDAGFDAGTDAGTDAGFDAGFDAGPPEEDQPRRRGRGAWWQNQR